MTTHPDSPSTPSTPSTDSERLEDCYPVLAALSAPARERLLRAAQWMRVPSGAMLFDDLQSCEGFPFVIEGSVRVSKCAPSGRELPLYRVGPGETCIISSSCLLGKEDYNARGVTEAETELVLLAREESIGGGVGLGFRDSDDALREKFDAAIKSMKCDGTLDAMITKAEYFGPEAKTWGDAGKEGC